VNGNLALVRATHLNDYIAVLRDIGAPVDRALAHSKLPPRIEETPDLYVSVPVAIEWVARTGYDLCPMELGFEAAKKASLASLRPAQQAAILGAQTGLMRLTALAAIARTEDSALDMRIAPAGDDIRVICTMEGLDRHPFACLTEWLNLQAVISVVRSVAGASWCPREMGFVSACRPPPAVLAAFPDTRILVGQSRTSIMIGRDLCAARTEAVLAAEPVAGKSPDDASTPWEFVRLMRMLVQPYLNAGRTDIAFAADVAGISTRSLQRRLTAGGTSYSQILLEARFDLACAQLGEPSLKIIDVAMMAGYESPQHFTRAFRRFTGVTPSAYRQIQKVADHQGDRMSAPRTAEAVRS
jgi:AraC-like DNA-binding protein